MAAKPRRRSSRTSLGWNARKNRSVAQTRKNPVKVTKVTDGTRDSRHPNG